jgi:hypothetical protein
MADRVSPVGLFCARAYVRADTKWPDQHHETTCEGKNNEHKRAEEKPGQRKIA